MVTMTTKHVSVLVIISKKTSNLFLQYCVVNEILTGGMGSSSSEMSENVSNMGVDVLLLLSLSHDCFIPGNAQFSSSSSSKSSRPTTYINSVIRYL